MVSQAFLMESTIQFAFHPTMVAAFSSSISSSISCEMILVAAIFESPVYLDTPMREVHSPVVTSRSTSPRFFFLSVSLLNPVSHIIPHRPSRARRFLLYPLLPSHVPDSICRRTEAVRWCRILPP